MNVAPFITDIGVDYGLVRWVDNQGLPGGLMSGDQRLVEEKVTELARGEGWVHTVRVPLVDDAVRDLRVRCGPWAGQGVRLRRPPALGRPLTFVALGDNRSEDQDHSLVIRGARSVLADVLINTGDMVMTSVPEDWTTFFRIERNLLATTPLFPAFGNHEAINRPELYDHVFVCPRPGLKGTRSCVRDYGDLRVIQVDSEARVRVQRPWIESVLAEAPPAGGRRVVVIAMHRPVYTFSRHPPALHWRDAIHPLARKYGVEVVFQGHNHTYERFVVDGVTYVTTGGGGAPRYPADYRVIPEEAHLRRKGASVLHYVVGRVMAGRIDLEVVEVPSGAVIDKFQVGEVGTTSTQ